MKGRRRKEGSGGDGDEREGKGKGSLHSLRVAFEQTAGCIVWSTDFPLGLGEGGPGQV